MTSGMLASGPFVLDREARHVTVSGKRIGLTTTEFRLLQSLLEHEGRALSRPHLLEGVWQAQPDMRTRTVDMHVRRLRAKLGKAADWIETVRNVGYRLRRPSPAPPQPHGRRTRGLDQSSST